MRGLLQFIYRFRVFELFIFLEAICAWLIIQNNRYHNVAFLSSSNAAVASLNSFTNNAEKYFDLNEINQELANENALLRKELSRYIYTDLYQDLANDSLYDRYEVIPAKVINNTTNKADNYFTIDKGTNHGINEGMGVIGSKGIIGQVKVAGRNFSTVTSILHSDLMVSSSLKNNGAFCTTQWNGIDPLYSTLQFVPRHLAIEEGDTVVTSGFNSVYPPGVMIGVIDEYSLKENQSFYDIKIKLASDLSVLSHVYVTNDRMAAELDSLELLSE